MGVSAMTMWRLWKGLKHPSNDPMYVRLIDDVYDDTKRVSRFLQNVLLQGQVWLWPLLFIVDMRLVCLMVFSGTISGMILTLRVSNRIAVEQRSRTYDLLCLTPGGTIRTLWAICTGSLHREKAFEILNSLEAWVVRFGLFVPFIISSQLFLQRVLGMKGGVTLTWGIGFILLFYIDHIQATVFGCLSGMLAAQHTSSMDQRLWAAAAFATFQVCSYLFTILVSLFILPDICQGLTGIGISSEISQMLLTVTVFYFMRQGIISLGWKHLMEDTNTQPTDIDFLNSDFAYPQFKLHDDTQTVARA
jgi:hypothetical protein